MHENIDWPYIFEFQSNQYVERSDHANVFKFMIIKFNRENKRFERAEVRLVYDIPSQ